MLLIALSGHKVIVIVCYIPDTNISVYLSQSLLKPHLLEFLWISREHLL